MADDQAMSRNQACTAAWAAFLLALFDPCKVQKRCCKAELYSLYGRTDHSLTIVRPRRRVVIHFLCYRNRPVQLPRIA